MLNMKLEFMLINYIHKNHRFKSFKAKYTFGEYGNRVTAKHDLKNDRENLNFRRVLYFWLVIKRSRNIYS